MTISYPQNAAGSVLGGSTHLNNLSWSVFKSKPGYAAITDSMVASAISDLQAINFSGASDNYLKVVAYPRDSGWDWFDDTGWNKVLNNIGKMARVAYQGNLKGFSFDPEEYGVPMWSWGGSRPDYRLANLPEYANRTWTETRAKVYERGVSFGQAMTAEFPGIDVWTLYGYSHISHIVPHGPANLSNADNGLYAAFFDGMLRGTNTDSIFVDGGEGAYRYIQRDDFSAMRAVIKNVAPAYSLESALYSQKVRAGFGLFLDQYRYVDSLPWDSTNPQNNYMTPADLEYRLRNALAESDGYVWIYSEIPSWWLDSADDSFENGVRSRDDHGWVDPAYREAVERTVTATEQLVTENFDSNPGWIQFGQPVHGIDIGFSASNNAGGATGEAGGIFERFPTGAARVGSYGTSLERAFTLDDPLSFSAKVFDSGDTEPYLGFYNEGDFVSSVPTNSPRAFLGYAPDINGDSYIKVYSPGGNAVTDATTDVTGQFEVYVAYDPDSGMTHPTCGGTGNACGQITYSIDGLDHPETLDLSPNVRNSGVEFTHFGLNVLSDSHGSGFRSGTFYIDDVTFTRVGGGPPELATQFEWNANGIGDWAGAGNWSPQDGTAEGPQANSPDHTAIFGAALTESTNISTMADVTVNRIVFNNHTISYVVSGLGRVHAVATIDINGPVNPSMSVTGSHRFQAAVSLDAPTTIYVAGGSQLIFDGPLSLGGHTLTHTGSGIMIVNNQFLAGSGTASGSIMGISGVIAGHGTISGDLDNMGGTVSPGHSVALWAVDGNHGAEISGQVPEPSSCFLLLVGLLGLGGWSRRMMI